MPPRSAPCPQCREGAWEQAETDWQEAQGTWDSAEAVLTQAGNIHEQAEVDWVQAQTDWDCAQKAQETRERRAGEKRE